MYYLRLLQSTNYDCQPQHIHNNKNSLLDYYNNRVSNHTVNNSVIEIYPEHIQNNVKNINKSKCEKKIENNKQSVSNNSKKDTKEFTTRVIYYRKSNSIYRLENNPKFKPGICSSCFINKTLRTKKRIYLTCEKCLKLRRRNYYRQKQIKEELMFKENGKEYNTRSKTNETKQKKNEDSDYIYGLDD